VAYNDVVVKGVVCIGWLVGGTGRKMYWTDAQRGVIESSSLDGSGRVVLIDERRSVTLSSSSNKSSLIRPHYYGIALDQNYLYYTDWARGSVYSARVCF